MNNRKNMLGISLPYGKSRKIGNAYWYVLMNVEFFLKLYLLYIGNIIYLAK